jgi:hypothetical protein
VFTNAKNGGPIDQSEFPKRYWNSAVRGTGIRPRKFYATRHTFISIALTRGVNAVPVSALREAVANVNALADTTGGDCVAGTGTGDTINFNLTFPAKIKLKIGELVIGQDVVIAGPTTGLLRILGHNSRLFKITAGTTDMSHTGGFPSTQSRARGLAPCPAR